MSLDARPLEPSSWQIFAQGFPVLHVMAANQLAPMAESLLCHILSRGCRRSFVLHAGLVEFDDGCVLIPGERGSGKSTLTLWLARHGARYFGDDLILVDKDQRRVSAFPKAVTLKQGSFALFEETETFADPIRGPVRYYLPDTGGLYQKSLEQIRLIVFLQYETHVECSVGRLGVEWTALALVQQLFGGLKWSDTAMNLAARLAQVPAYVVRYGRLAEAERAIRDRLKSEVAHAAVS